MTIKSLSRLGVANCVVPNAGSFAQTVLQLQNAPVYQQQIAHSIAWRHGPGVASAEWCSQADGEAVTGGSIIRQISPHNTFFARRNLSNTPQYAWVWHKDGAQQHQIYCVNNEPEAYSTSAAINLYCNSSGCTGSPPTPWFFDVWSPPDDAIDPLFSSFWPSGSGFWEGFYDQNGWWQRRISAQALAYAFVTLKRIAEYHPVHNPNYNRNHFVLPPPSAGPTLGLDEPYWAAFFNRLHNPQENGNLITAPGGAAQAKLPVAELRALHIHSYAPYPGSFNPSTPLDSVAVQSIQLLQGVEWYRNTFNGGQPLPLDVLISEMGLYWQIGGSQRWAGGWMNMRLGLAWWNSWLHWLLYVAPGQGQFNLASGYTTYGCIHEATEAPYVTRNQALSSRNQWFVNCSSWSQGVYYSAPAIDTALPTDGRYQGSFSALNSIQFEKLLPCNQSPVYWRRTPFGACYTIWSLAYNDPLTYDLSTGWTVQNAAGTIGDAIVGLPQAGYHTIYIPVAKHPGAFPGNTSITVQWIRDDGGIVPYTTTWMDMSEFQDSGTFYYFGRSQSLYSAMIFPFVCYVSSPRNVRLRLVRNVSGPYLSIGRPRALAGMCSWMTTQ